MDSKGIRAALGTLETQLERAREAKNQRESEIAGSDYSKTGYEDPEAVLEHHLNYIFNFLAVILEVAGLSETRSHLIQR
jgi:hypothetical protein